MDATANPNLSPCITHQPSLLGGAENMKLLFDDTMAHLSRIRGIHASQDQAWETLRFTSAQRGDLVAHLAQLNVIISSQSGDTQGQSPQSPIRTGAADNLAAGSAPANRVVDETGAVASGAVDAAIAGIATASDAITSAVAKLVDAADAIIAAATGLASKNAAGAGSPSAAG